MKTFWKKELNWVTLKAPEIWRKNLMSHSTVYEHVKQIRKKKNLQKGIWVSRELSQHSTPCSNLLIRNANNSFSFFYRWYKKKSFAYQQKVKKTQWLSQNKKLVLEPVLYSQFILCVSLPLRAVGTWSVNVAL